MSNYFKNLWLWLSGWRRFHEIESTLGWKEGWSASSPKWIATYLFNISVNVLTGGAVQPLSSRMHLHRDGWVNDKVLDIIEKFDPGHGGKSMPPLWGSVESPRAVQIGVTVFIFVAVLLWLR